MEFAEAKAIKDPQVRAEIARLDEVVGDLASTAATLILRLEPVSQTIFEAPEDGVDPEAPLVEVAQAIRIIRSSLEYTRSRLVMQVNALEV